MAENIVNLGASLKLDGARTFVVQMERVGDATENTAKDTKKLSTGMKRVSGSFARAGRGLANFTIVATGALRAVGAIGRGLRSSLDTFADYELGIARIGTVLPRGEDALKRFGTANLGAAVKFGQSTAVINDATFQALSAGVSSADEVITPFMDTIGKAAVAGFADMNVVVDGVTNALNAFGIDVSRTEEITDRFLVTNNLAKTTIAELSGSLGKVAPTAKALGVSLDEVLAATVSLTKGGISTSESMNSLKAVLANISKPSKDAQKIASDLSIDFSVAGLKAKGFAGFLDELVGATEDNVEAQVGLFGSVEAFNAIARLASEEGTAEFTNALDALNNSAGETQARFEGVAKTTGFRLRQLKQGFGALVTELGGGIADGLGLDRIKDIPAAVQSAGEGVRAAASAFASGFSQAFAPLNATAEFDWKGLAVTIGSAMGNAASAIISAARGIATAINTIAGSIRGFLADLSSGGPAKAFADKQGGGVFRADSAVTKAVDVRNAIRSGQISAFNPLAFATALTSGTPFSRRGTAAGAAEVIRRQRKRNRFGLIASGLAARGTAGAAGSSGSQAAVAALAARGQSEVIANITQKITNNVNLNNKKKASSTGGRSFKGRGRGSAEVATTLEQSYIISEDRLIPVSDEFNFSNLGTVV